MDRDLRGLAYQVAVAAHKGQTRYFTGEPFMGHPARVAQMAHDLGCSKDLVVAALLHDVLEDTTVTLPELEAHGFSARSLELVRLLSKTWKEDASIEVKAAGKVVYYAGIMADPDARLLKVLDRTDNLRDTVKASRWLREQNLDRADFAKWARRYVQRTHLEISPIAAKVQDQAREGYRQALVRAAEEVGQ